MTRIFVVGFPRSGTTLLQSLVGAHEALTTFSESHLFKLAFLPWRMYRPWHKRRNPITPRVEDFLRENGLQALGASDAARSLAALDKRRGGRGVELAKAIVSLFDQIAIAENKSGWLEKTPHHLYYCDLITKASPDAHFVHIARQGEDAVASIVSVGPKWENGIFASPTYSARCWNEVMKRSLRYAKYPYHHFVTYEDLTMRPEIAVNRLVAGLGLPPDPNLLDRYRDVAQRVALPTEPWKALNDQPIQKRSTFNEVFNEVQRATVQGVLNPELYERFRQLAGSCRKSFTCKEKTR
jgi:Sulfotransferase family